MDAQDDYYELHELPDFDELWGESAGAAGARAPVYDLGASVGELVAHEEGGETRRERKRRDTRDFLKGFFAALAVMLPLCAGTLFIGYDPFGLDEAAREVSQSAENVPVAATGGCTLLCAATENGELLSLALVRADADGRAVSFAELPVNTVALDARRPSALTEIWRVKGLSGVAAAVADTLGVRVDARAALPADLLAELVDSLGGFRMSLDRDVVVYAPGGLVQYSKHRGSSDFCGNDIKQLLLHAPHSGDELTRLRERTFEAAYGAAADDALADALSRFFAKHGDDIETDLNSAGAYSLSRILHTACSGGEGALNIVRLPGVYTEDGRFELAEGSADELWARFPRAA